MKTRSRFAKRTIVCWQCDTVENGLHPLLAVTFWGEHWEHPDMVSEFNEDHAANSIAAAALVVIRAERDLRAVVEA